MLAFNLVIRKWPELVDMEAGISGSGPLSVASLVPFVRAVACTHRRHKRSVVHFRSTFQQSPKSPIYRCAYGVLRTRNAVGIRGFRGLLFKVCFEKRRPNRLGDCPKSSFGEHGISVHVGRNLWFMPLKRRFGEIRLLSWNDVIW